MKKPSTKSPSEQAEALRAAIMIEFSISDAAGLVLLENACSSYERLLQAQEIIKRDGPIVKDRYGVLKSSPACAIERNAKQSMLSALKALNLDLEPLHTTLGRPPGRN